LYPGDLNLSNIRGILIVNPPSQAFQQRVYEDLSDEFPSAKVVIVPMEKNEASFESIIRVAEEPFSIMVVFCDGVASLLKTALFLVRYSAKYVVVVSNNGSRVVIPKNGLWRFLLGELLEELRFWMMVLKIKVMTHIKLGKKDRR
jgi:hypothetical protein